MIFAAIPWLLTQARASIIGALGDPFLRVIVCAFALLMGGYALKGYWQSGMVAKTDIEAATQAARTDALATRAVIEQQRDASEQADAAALLAQAAKMEHTRNEWQTSADTTAVLIPADDGWLRGKTGGRSH